jgi:diacylglycerol kinase family enzyme
MEEMSVAVLVNVHARHGSERIGARIRGLLPRANVAVTHSLDDASEWVRRVVRDDAPRVLVAGGGDGTAIAVLNHLRQENLSVPALGLLPLGTGNAWARATGVASKRAGLRSLEGLADGRDVPVRTFQLVETEGRLTPFAGTGWDAEMLSDYRKMIESKPAALRVASGGTGGYLRSLFTRTIPRKLSAKDRPILRLVNLGEPALRIDEHGNPVPVHDGGVGAVLYEGPVSVAGAATTEELGLGFRAFRFAHLVPGRMAVRVYAATTLSATLRMPLLWRGAHPLPDDHNWMLTRCRMEFDRPVPFEIGGDLAGDRTSVELNLAEKSVALVDWRKMATRRM